MFQRRMFWPSFAAVMGFVVGASVVWGIQFHRPPAPVVMAQQHIADNESRSKKETAEEAIATYTLWLMGFTGILAFATIGLGGATVGLYVTGEKQIKVAMRAAEAAQRSADATERSVIDADRAWLEAQIQLAGNLIFSPDSIEISAERGALNVGKSPAIGAWGEMKLFADAADAQDWIKREAAAAQTKSIDKTEFGHMLFPGRQAKFGTLFCNVALEDFRGKIDKTNASIPDGEAIETEGRPALACFVRYALPSEGLTAVNRYSGDIFEICPVGGHIPWRGFDGSPRTVPIGELELKKTILGGRAS